MYKHIYVPVDNSDFSNRAIDLAVELGRAFGSKLTGCHVYAARLHDYRFKQMEYTLPEEYKDETELERQRKIHDSLIAMGLQLISESYLDVMKAKAEAAGLAFAPRMMDGKHYKALIDDTLASDYDLVIMGALGMGAVKDSQLGSVTERFVRRVTRDTLVVRNHDALRDAQGAIVVGPGRLAPVLPRPQARPGPGQGAQPAGPGHRRLRSLPALRDVQRHRRRAEREGVEDLPLQGAGAAARGDHRYRPGQDLPVAPGDRPQAGRGRRRGSLDHAARRQVLREDADLRPQGAAVAPDPGPRRRALRRERGRSRLQHREPPAPGARATCC